MVSLYLTGGERGDSSRGLGDLRLETCAANSK
jgi:hypothetical protein